MAIIDINLNPSRRDLRWFGLVLLSLFCVIGGVIRWHSGSWTPAIILASIGTLLCVVYYAIRPFQRPMFIGWMRAVYPIGWTISHIILGVTFYLILTPLRLLTRLFGKDEMNRQLEPNVESYWEEHIPNQDPSSYFRQS